MNTPTQTINPWDPRLVMDLAIGIDSAEDISERYDLSTNALDALYGIKSFRQEVAAVMKDVRENGVTFRAKAKIQAEDYLEIMDKLIYNSEIPAGVRLDAIKSAVKWAGLEPKDEKTHEDIPQVNIQINF